MFRVKSTRRNSKRPTSETLSEANVAGESIAPDVAPAVAPAVPAVPAVAPAVPAVPAVAPAVPITAPPGKPTTSNTVAFFAAESAATALTKPWLRLERGLRLQRFRAYADAYPGLSSVERARLCDVLVAANDKKLLNTKQQVTYENGVIQSIRGLKIIRTGDAAEPAVIKIEPPRLTKRNTEDV